MVTPAKDDRSPERRERDEKIAAEAQLAHPELPCDAASKPVEAFMAKKDSHPTAVVGVVESGLVRPLDPAVKLTERSRVIIVTSEEG